MTTGARNLLHLVSIFRDLDTEKTNAIGDWCTWHKLPAQQIVVDQNDTGNDVYFVTDGRLSIKLFSSQGKEVGYAELSRGDTFGEFSAIDGAKRSASVETLTDATVASMSADAFRDLLAKEPCVGLRLSELLVAKNRLLTRRIFEFSTLSVPHRVAVEVLRMAQEVGGDEPVVIEDIPTHYQIASRISSNREAVSRTISALARKGIIETAPRRITVLDKARLRAEAGLDIF